jgi:hypothetical protein
MKSPLYLTNNLSGGQLPPMLWSWHVNLLSRNFLKKKEEGRNPDLYPLTELDSKNALMLLKKKKEKFLIGKSVGPKPMLVAWQNWLHAFNEIGGQIWQLNLCPKIVGKGYHMLGEALMRSPHQDNLGYMDAARINPRV